MNLTHFLHEPYTILNSTTYLYCLGSDQLPPPLALTKPYIKVYFHSCNSKLFFTVLEIQQTTYYSYTCMVCLLSLLSWHDRDQIFIPHPLPPSSDHTIHDFSFIYLPVQYVLWRCPYLKTQVLHSYN